MKQYIIPLLFILFAVSCGGGQNKAGDQTAYQKVIESVQVTGRDTIDLGRMQSGEQVEYLLGVRNVDSTALAILEIRNSCSCTMLTYEKQPVKPGDTAFVRVRYDSNRQFGSQFKHIQIVTSLHERPLNVFIQAEVVN